MSASSKIAVVGGGILGLTIALRLSQAGKKIVLLESANEIGGLASAWQLDDVVWDRHYHVTLLSDSATRSMLTELGLEQDMRWVATRTGCYSGGELYSMSNVIDYIKFPDLGIVSKARLATTILAGSRIKDWKSLEKLSAEDWLVKWSGRDAFDNFWLPLLRSKLGDSYRSTSAAFIWATIQRLYAARRTGMKQEMFGYLPGGYARILRNFGRKLESAGVEIRLSSRVNQARGNGNGVEIDFYNHRSESFKAAILTTAAPIVEKMIPDLNIEERTKLKSVDYLGIICASVLLDKPLSDFYVTNLIDSNLPFTGIIEMTALIDPSELAGRHLVYLPRYLTGDSDFVERSDDEIELEFMKGLMQIHPGLSKNSVKAFRISRVRYVLPIQSIDYSSKILPHQLSVPGLFVANSSQITNGTLNVNETLTLANNSADIICKSLDS